MIPKVIHYLWLSDEKPSDIEQCLATWKEHLVGYEIREWNKSNFPYRDFLWTREAYSMKKWAFVTDFFRLWVLYNYGGIYMDADVTMYGTFDRFLYQPMFIGTESVSKIESHVIGAVKQHPYIHYCLQYYNNKHFIREDGSLDMMPIPNIMTRIFMSLYHYDGVLNRFDGTPMIFKDITIYPDTYFTIRTYDGNNVCYHHAFGSWRDNTTSQNSLVEDYIGNYYITRYFSTKIFHIHKGLKKILFLIMPIGLLAIRYRRRLKIKSNKRIKTIDISNIGLAKDNDVN